MNNKQFYFISGLPRSGSTLLSSILNQNPNFHTSITSPLLNLIRSSLEIMNKGDGLRTLHDNDVIKSVLTGLFESYYCKSKSNIIFDTNRIWTNILYLLKELYPNTKIICCVRDILWIMDSFEQLRNKNPYSISTIFPNEVDLNVYTRCNALMQENGLIGSAYQALKTGMSSQFSDSIFLVEYEQLCKNPSGMLRAIYNFIEQPYFDHDFSNVEKTYNEYDTEVGLKNLHFVRKSVRFVSRKTCIPPDLWDRYSNMEFWKDV